jgi:methylthioribose-1-phosphate isomerase
MDALFWQEKALSLLDQTKYPKEEIWFECTDFRAVVNALSTPAVSGEAILASAGAYGYCLAALEYEGSPEFYKNLMEAKGAIQNSRPDCAALSAAIKRLDKTYEEYRNSSELVTALLATAVIIHRQNVVACRAMCRYGRDIIPEEAKLVVSCRDGVFHTGSFGGVIGTLRSAAMKNKLTEVFLCENRPGLEGTLKIAHELAKNNIPTTVIPDHAAASLMPRRSCDMVLIEGIKAAANGDVLAGPGTYELAIAAYFHGIPVYATVFSTAIDSAIPNGDAYPQDDGDPVAVSHFAGSNLLPDGVSAWTPNYDMLPQYLLTGLITDRGLVFPPYDETISEMLSKSEEKPVVFL